MKRFFGTPEFVAKSRDPPQVELASNAPTNVPGVGGAPGEGVIIKVGASILEPLKINTNNFYLMNIDKGNQMNPGADMDTIGHVGVSDTTTDYTLINRGNATHLFNITTDANGKTWVCTGTDSGYESTTTLYYNKIVLTFSTVLRVDKNENTNNPIIYPNPARDFIIVKNKNGLKYPTYAMIDMSGNKVMAGKLNNGAKSINIGRLEAGMYFLKIGQRIFKS